MRLRDTAKRRCYPPLSSTLILCILLQFLHSIFAESSDVFQEFSASGEKALFPNIFNLATHAEIRATSTCGQNGPEYYCKLVEHVFLRQPQCDICDANDHAHQHPIDYAIDGTRRWWQSPSLGNGLIYENVNVTIDLRQEYQVAYVILKAGISPRPGTWALEKSLDGVNFQPWQYFAISDSDCLRHFDMPATVGLPKFTRDDEVICTSYYSKLNPLEYGEVHTSLINGRPGANHSSSALQAFTKTRFVRLRLLGLRNLNADLMVINRRDGKLDQSVTRRYFYTISDISIGGQCICYGHAERCPPEEVHGQFRCECRHNTNGESCSQCLPLYNQLPWRPGTHDQPNICQQCQCFNHANRCEYDPEVERHRSSVTPEGIYEGGGRCVDCQHNTDGINCEKCREEYYRPANHSHYRPDACRPCDCDVTGSLNNNCVRDETEAHDDLKPGDCVCKPGFGGRRCDRCALGYRNHPLCEPCPCNRAGSLNFETCEETSCSCKANVEGEFCDRCKPGMLYLDVTNPLGCQPCFCFGKTGECKEERWAVTNVYPNTTGYKLTDLYDRIEVPLKSPVISLEPVIFNSEEYHEYNGDNELIYWKVPITGNWLNSYGSNIHYYVYYVPNDRFVGEQGPVGHPTSAADFVIEGNSARLEYYSRLSFFPRENISVTVPLRVDTNWFDARSRRPADRADIMRVFANVENVFVRAKYHQIQIQSSIYGIRRESVVPEGTQDATSLANGKILPVEVCSCPEHFEGTSCERCEFGYRRVANQLYDGMCEKCECQEHSYQCDPFTGHCINCQHNTTGPRCELCAPGYYGNPSLGGELGACQPCACPTIDNSRSAQCALSQLVFEGAAAAGQDAYVCTACEAGYDGNKCEICADGYFGDPLNATTGCRPCDCNGNVDTAAIGNCDRETGVCLRCVGNTVGEHCERCADNHWGDARDHNCTPCNCHYRGAVSPQCDKRKGACECAEGYRGVKCDRCSPGHGDADTGCPPCECDALGATGETCDEMSGQCLCKNGVYGKHCDKCIPSYFNFTAGGCQFCHCNAFGAVPGKECHNVTGECQCQPNVVGVGCERCTPGFYNISSGAGCQECECDPMGAVDETCDVITGQCYCKEGVTGLKCNECAPNHWGMYAGGCKSCQVCPAPGQVCDRLTGECVCPPNTEGSVCERCTPNAWNYDPYRGCKLCACDGIGADSAECNPRTGQCKCKSGYVGHRCDRCEAGFFNFPDCEPCNCDLAGTEREQCRGPTCLCANDGQCKCKKHVTGLKCDQCAANSFSLEAQNPAGCTECFCFNRTTSCAQGEFVWRQIYSPDRRVHFESPFEYYTRRYNIHILRDAPPFNYNSYPTNSTPLYWPLPRTFLGDRTTSYNGWIRFRIRNDANYRGQIDAHPDPNSFRLFPLVHLIGNHRIELEYLPGGEISYDGKYKVHLHESAWRNRLSPQLSISRKQFMVALQNVQAIYVRGSYVDVHRGDSISISELSVDVASLKEAAENGGENVALGVEECRGCAVGYTGASCQNPAPGYCRKRDPDYLNRADDLALVGWSAPCACNGHSEICDPENCRCKDCTHNTTGDFCELCRPGFYGNAVDGHAHVCHKCACPHADNSSSDTCHSVPSGRGYVCDSCRPGYEGQYCERCSVGYYGAPTAKNGFCAPCACHAHGSVHGVCGNVTGQCECRYGVTGRDCSQCSARYAFMDGVCTSCDRGCHKELMRIEDEMEYALGSVQNLTELKPIPRKRLSRISSMVSSLDEILDNFKSGALLGEHDGADSRFKQQASVVEQEVNLLQERNSESAARLQALNNDLDALRALANAQNHRAIVISDQLAQIASANGGEDQNQSDQDYLLMHAEHQLNGTLLRNNLIEKSFNYAKKNAEDAEKLLSEILAKKLDDSEYKKLQKKYEELSAAVRDYRNLLWDRANADVVVAKQMAQAAGERLTILRGIVAEIEALSVNARDGLQAGNGAIDAIKEAIESVHNIYKEVEEQLFTELKEQSERLRQFAEEKSSNAQAQADVAMRHVIDLERRVYTLKGAFDSVQSSDAFVASNSYKGIVSAMKDAINASHIAKQNANDAFALVNPSQSDSLVSQVVASRNRSDQLNLDLEKALREISSLRANQRMKTALERLDVLEKEASQNITWIKDVQQLLDDHHDRIDTVHTTIDEAHDGLEAVKQRTEDFTRDVEDVKERADAIHSFNQQAIREDISNVSQNTAAIGEVERSLDDVKARTDRQVDQADAIRQDLNILREKINEAREKASKIRIAVKSEMDDNCVREYIAPMSPSASNTISIRYRPAIDSPDSLIFLVTTKGTRSQSREYIAVELRGKKLHVVWDIGSGRREAAIIKRNIVYIPNSDRYTWYHIDVRRIANTMQVGVVQKQTIAGERASNIDEPTQVYVGDVDVNADVIFNAMPGQTRIYLGHVNDPLLVDELRIAGTSFRGTVGELSVDGTNVPLWMFDKSSGNCDGATAPQAPAAAGHMFRNGFAQVRLPTNDWASSLITVQFSAYSSNGLLYFRGSATNGEFVAISLRDDAVELSANYGRMDENGENVQVKLRSGRASYADGRVHKVRAIRNKGEIHLQIDQDDHISTALADDGAILEITEPDHYVGGVPPNFNQSAFEGHDVQFSGFFGCIHSIRPNQLSELDLHFPYRSQHKELGCAYREDRLTSSDRVIGFSNPAGGFVLVKGVEINVGDADKASTFSYNFRSRRANALLVYQSGELQKAARRKRNEANEREKSFIGVYLSNGNVVVQLGIGAKELTLSSSSSYSDGLLHSMFLARSGVEIHVRIDDRESLHGALDSEAPIGAEASRPLLAIGGLPPNISPKGLVTGEPLLGCLFDFQLNYDRLPLVIEEHFNANLGVCEFEQGLIGTGLAREPASSSSTNEATGAQEIVNFERRKSSQSLEPAQPTASVAPKPNGRDPNSDDGYTSDSSLDAYSEPFSDSGHSPLGGRAQRREACAANSVRESPVAANGVRFGITESSHARINFPEKPYPDYANFKLSFAFRTRQKSGLLWAWASYKNYTRYFFLSLEHGFLRLTIKGHREPKHLHYNARKFNDDEWHAVELAKLDHEINLQVDTYPAEYLRDAPNPKVMRKRMYVGGVISKHRKLFNKKMASEANDENAERAPRMAAGFVGCIRDFRVNGVEKDLLKTSRDLVPCANVRDIAYVHEGGFAMFDSLKNYGKMRTADGMETNELEVSLKFRLNSQQGIEKSEDKTNGDLNPANSKLIFGMFATNEENYRDRRVLLKIDNDTLVLSAHFERDGVHVEERFDSSSIGAICAGEWHRLTLLFSAERASAVKLNGERAKSTQLRVSHAMLEEIADLPVHVGGTTAPISVSLKFHSLVGCVTNLEFSGLIVSVNSARKLHKVVEDGCPYSS